MPPDTTSSVQELQYTCPRCGHRTAVRPLQINHRLHLAATVFSLGLWGVSWLVLIASRKFWPLECTHCSAHFSEEEARAATRADTRPRIIDLDAEDDERMDAEIREVLQRREGA
jgi:transcription elongation factor Elf1